MEHIVGGIWQRHSSNTWPPWAQSSGTFMTWQLLRMKTLASWSTTYVAYTVAIFGVSACLGTYNASAPYPLSSGSTARRRVEVSRSPSVSSRQFKLVFKILTLSYLLLRPPSMVSLASSSTWKRRFINKLLVSRLRLMNGLLYLSRRLIPELPHLNQKSMSELPHLSQRSIARLPQLQPRSMR